MFKIMDEKVDRLQKCRYFINTTITILDCMQMQCLSLAWNTINHWVPGEFKTGGTHYNFICVASAAGEQIINSNWELPQNSDKNGDLILISILDCF